MGCYWFSFSGIEFSVEITEIPEMNYSNVISKIDKLLTGWKQELLDSYW